MWYGFDRGGWWPRARWTHMCMTQNQVEMCDDMCMTQNKVPETHACQCACGVQMLSYGIHVQPERHTRYRCTYSSDSNNDVTSVWIYNNTHPPCFVVISCSFTGQVPYCNLAKIQLFVFEHAPKKRRHYNVSYQNVHWNTKLSILCTDHEILQCRTQKKLFNFLQAQWLIYFCGTWKGMLVAVCSA